MQSGFWSVESAGLFYPWVLRVIGDSHVLVGERHDSASHAQDSFAKDVALQSHKVTVVGGRARLLD